MTYLTVGEDPEPGTPEYCAKQQELAAQAIDKARKDIQAEGTPTGTNGSTKAYEPVWTTHGCYVGRANDALDSAVDSRDQACKKLKEASAYLASLCKEASKRYKEVDHSGARSLDKQLVHHDDKN